MQLYPAVTLRAKASKRWKNEFKPENTSGAWLFLMSVILFVVIDMNAITREEEYLEKEFGETYMKYKKQSAGWAWDGVPEELQLT